MPAWCHALAALVVLSAWCEVLRDLVNADILVNWIRNVPHPAVTSRIGNL